MNYNSSEIFNRKPYNARINTSYNATILLISLLCTISCEECTFSSGALNSLYQSKPVLFQINLQE